MTDEHRRVRDLEMLNTPDQWYGYPTLPLVKRHPPKGPDCGFVVAGQGATLYLGNIFALETGFLKPQLDKLQKKEYPSFEALLDDGWEVD